jgi:alcohol dehydrogenase
MNALCLPPALRFNAIVAPKEVVRFDMAIRGGDPARKVEELARLGGFERLRDFGIPREELPEVAEAAAQRPGARNNPREASAAEIERMLGELW